MAFHKELEAPTPPRTIQQTQVMNRSAFPHGHPHLVQLHSPHLRVSNAVPLLSDGQETVSADKEFDEGANVDKKHGDARSTVQDGFVRIINIDAKLNNRMGETLERTSSISPCHSTPLLLVNKEGDTFVRLEATATMKLILILVLLSTALRALLQSNLPTPVACYLLMAVVSAFSYLLLLAPQCQRNYVCVMYAAHVCFGITIFAIAIATTLQAWNNTQNSSVGS